MTAVDPHDRVAVIVVHGIADQRPGQTVRELARLPCHGSEGEPRYVEGEFHEVLVPVEKLEPGSPENAAPDPKVEQSARRLPGTPSGFYQTQRQVNPPPKGAAATSVKNPDAPASPDLG